MSEPGTATPRLVVRGVQKAFGRTRALVGVDLEVWPGEVHALVGENGAGKSTLVKILSGALTADAGEIRLDGTPYAPATPLDGSRRGVAMVYQELSLVPHLDVADNILLGREPSRFGLLPVRAMRRQAAEVLAALGHPGVRPDTPVGQLPIAVQQLIEIGRAVSQPHTRVLILDEPTSSLAARDVEQLFATIRRLRDNGLSVIYISHVLEEIGRIADRLTVLRDGATVATLPVRDLSAPAIISLMAGRDIAEIFPRSHHEPGRVVLELHGVSGIDKPTEADLELRAGEVLGIGGLVGAGRTELLRAIFGLDPVRRGTVRVGVVATAGSPWRRLAEGVGLLSEDRKGEGLAVTMSLADNLTLSNLRGLGPGGLILPKRQEAVATQWMTRLGIRAAGPGQPVQHLSGGNQQKVALARLLYHDVDVLLLDEPTRGIDVGSKTHVYDLIDRLARSGKAILMVSSYLPELLGVCDRVAVMTRGHLGRARSVADLTEHEVLTEAMGQA